MLLLTVLMTIERANQNFWSIMLVFGIVLLPIDTLSREALTLAQKTPHKLILTGGYTN